MLFNIYSIYKILAHIFFSKLYELRGFLSLFTNWLHTSVNEHENAEWYFVQCQIARLEYTSRIKYCKNTYCALNSTLATLRKYYNLHNQR